MGYKVNIMVKKITVVTVCYNAEKVLEQTMLSVLSQTYKDIEYLVIDVALKMERLISSKNIQIELGGLVNLIKESMMQ